MVLSDLDVVNAARVGILDRGVMNRVGIPPNGVSGTTRFRI
jgi:hypothetical protein